jgi:subtilisin family serine protease
MKVLILLAGNRIRIILILLPLFGTCFLYGQEPVYPFYYRVYLRDKGENIIHSYKAADLLSANAIARRQKARIQAPDIFDIPVSRNYLNQISLLGLRLHSTSKWMNSALYKSLNEFDVSKLLALPFVDSVKIVKTPGRKSGYNDKLNFKINQAGAIPYDRPLTMINGQLLHESGYDGKGVLIAILDGGFINADNISSLVNLRSRNGIKATYDFVNNDKSVYNASAHGTAVLSVLAGDISDQIEGTAPGADYLLLKTEDVQSEFPCEEDFWAAGAEFADSSGADIISSSLGYFNFDDPALNYKQSDLDGKTAFITRVADMAASKGIFVVNSAGNERNTLWGKIIFPSDGDSVLAVGAVDADEIISDFSSGGPSADGRIKPDNVAMGVAVTVQVSGNTTGLSSGTSFSCPVLSGIAACLLQAAPLSLNKDLIGAFHSSADRFTAPDSLYGYGIPDVVKALKKIQELYIKMPETGIIAGPNPTTGNFEIIFRDPPGTVTIELIALTGKLLFRKDFTDYLSRTITISELQHKTQGIYFLRVKNGNTTYTRKIIKLNNL